MAQPPLATSGFTFDHVALDLAPQQPSRVRRAWERVPTKAKQHRDRTVWKRAEAKPFQYETEQGGTGFAVQGTKRLRTKNVPAYPVKTGRGVDREQEAEATDDELFSRRRKSGRRSSINPAKKMMASPKSRLISAPRPSRFSTTPRSPLKNLRVMELTQSPRGESKKTRPSIGGVLGNGTPMRNAFAESSWTNRSPDRPALSPRKEVSPQKAFSIQAFSPPRPFVQREGSPSSKMFTPQKVFTQQNTQSPNQFSVPRFSPQVLVPLAPQSPPQRDQPFTQPSQEGKSSISETPRPRRRSARLSGADLPLENTCEQHMSIPLTKTDTSKSTEPAGTVWITAPEIQAQTIRTDHNFTPPAQVQNDDASVQGKTDVDEPSLQLQAELGAPVSPNKITLFPKQGKVEEAEDEDQITLFNNIHATFEAKDTPERITSPRKRSPSKEVMPLGESSSESTKVASPEQCESDENAEPQDTMDCDIEYASEDELTTRLEDWTDPAVVSSGSPEPQATQSRNAPRFSDDTTILRAFLSRAQAKRAAQALTAPNGSPTRASPRRSPRRALETVDGNSPPKSPLKSPAKSGTSKSRVGNTPPSKAPAMLSFDADESDELASPVKTTRRSTRPKPTTQNKTAPSLIPLRRTDGKEPHRLRKTEAQELAIVTRSNTRRNRGQAQMPMFVLQELSARELSPVKSRPSLPGAKAVDWNSELVEYLGEQTKPKPKAKAGAKRTKGLGTVNGTPARPRAAARPESSSSGTSAGSGIARPRPRRAQGQQS